MNRFLALALSLTTPADVALLHPGNTKLALIYASAGQGGNSTLPGMFDTRDL